jgi:hypothetical protein
MGKRRRSGDNRPLVQFAEESDCPNLETRGHSRHPVLLKLSSASYSGRWVHFETESGRAGDGEMSAVCPPNRTKENWRVGLREVYILEGIAAGSAGVTYEIGSPTSAIALVRTRVETGFVALWVIISITYALTNPR